MAISRRLFFAVGAASVGVFAQAWAQDPAATLPDPALLMGERSLGDPKAPVTVAEFFSLTCTHCAAFAREVMPDIKAKLVDTGKLRFVYHDYPLDQIALIAAMVARALPAERYEPFVSALLASQDRWAFAPDGGNSTEAPGQDGGAGRAGAATFRRDRGRRCAQAGDPDGPAAGDRSLQDRGDADLPVQRQESVGRAGV